MYKILAKPFFIGKKVVYLPTCHSTNEIALELLRKGAFTDGTVVITDFQTAGKGQHGNKWEANKGENITCSVILKPKSLMIEEQFILNVMTSLAVADWVKMVSQMSVKVKWPNDVYVGRNKISGILISNTLKGTNIYASVIGIGLNINQQHFSFPNTTSLSLLFKNKIYRLNDVLEDLMLCLERRYFQIKNNPKELWDDYHNSLYWKDEQHTFIRNNGRVFSGIIRRVDKSGKLVIELPTGEREFDFKEIGFVK